MIDLELLIELAAREPMDRAAIIAAMRREFTPGELRHIIVGAGAALVVHGGKPFAADVDCEVDSLEALTAMARRRDTPLSRSEINGSPRLEVGGFAELFYDPVTYDAVGRGIHPRAVTVEGVRVDSIPACVAWYQFMVDKVGRPKDYANLEIARSLAARGR
jgi:hypothetical protein